MGSFPWRRPDRNHRGAITMMQNAPRDREAMLRRPSTDAVPSHKPRRDPVGADGFDQPAPGSFGGEGDALGLSGLDRQRIQPKRLPAVIEPVEQPEMMAMQMEHGRPIGMVGEGQHRGAARLRLKCGRRGRREVYRGYPAGLL